MSSTFAKGIIGFTFVAPGLEGKLVESKANKRRGTIRNTAGSWGSHPIEQNFAIMDAVDAEMTNPATDATPASATPLRKNSLRMSAAARPGPLRIT